MYKQKNQGCQVNALITQFFFNATYYFNVRLTQLYLSSARPVVSEPKGLTLLLLLLVGWWEILARDMDTKKGVLNSKPSSQLILTAPLLPLACGRPRLKVCRGDAWTRHLRAASFQQRQLNGWRQLNILGDEGLRQIIRNASNVSTAHHSALF